MASPTDQRSKDVLFALTASGACEEHLNRLQLQKLIYLFDILALTWRNVGASRGFRPWHNGPYDASIQNAVDALAFRGFVTVTKVSFRKTRNVEARYGLTDAGVDAVAGLTQSDALASDLQLLREIATEVNARGWDNIKAIVYAEPTYNRARSKSEMSHLPTDNVLENLSWRLLNDVKRAFDVDRTTPMSPRTLVQVLFAILDEYRMSPDGTALKHP